MSPLKTSCKRSWTVRSRSGEPSRRARGASRVGCLIWIAVLIFAGYFGIAFAGSEIDYRQLESEAWRQAGLAAQQDDQAIIGILARRATELGLPASATRPTIRRFPGDRIQIIIQYPDVLDFFGRWQWVRHRRIQIDQTY